MNRPAQSPDKVSDQLHPLIHIAAAGLLIWFVVAAWLLFGRTGYIELILVMISVFVFMALAIPAALWRASVTARRSNISANATEPADTGEASKTMGTWLQGQFATWMDQEKSSTAAIEILLPIAAVAVGITALGIVFQLTVAGGV